MTFHLCFLFILAGLTGIHSITTVSNVSVKAGDSVSIPCLYGSQYVNHVKYLCQRLLWFTCLDVVKTNQPNSRKFSISDDKNQTIFTVSIHDLTNNDADYYCCAVEVNQGPDVREDFRLSVTTGTPSLYVDHQYISGFTGQNMTINCHYRNRGEMAWCRLVGRSCVTGSSGSIDGMRVTIDERIPDVFTVTMSDLRTESSGWYLCVKGDFQMPVHVTVNEQPITGHVTTLSPRPEHVNHTSPTAQGEHLSLLQSFGIRLSVIFFVMVTLFIWFIFKRHKQKKVATATAEVEVTYINVEYMKKTSGESSVQRCGEET